MRLEGYRRCYLSPPGPNGGIIEKDSFANSSAADEIVKQISDDRALGVEGDAGSIAAIEHVTFKTVKLPREMDILMACAGTLSMRGVGHNTQVDCGILMRFNLEGP